MGVDENSVRDVPGLVKVVVKNDFVGVVCEKPWQAIQAATRLKPRGPPASRCQRTTFFDYLRNQRPTRDTLSVDSLDVDQKLSQATEVVKATYHHPYQMHGSIGSSCAVADVQGERATIWSPTQSAHPLKSGVAMLLGFRRPTFVSFSEWDPGAMASTAPTPCHAMPPCCLKGWGGLFAFSSRVRTRWHGRTMGSPTSSISVWASIDRATSCSGTTRVGRPLSADGPMRAHPATSLRASWPVSSQLRSLPRTPAPAPTGALNNNANVVPSYLSGCIGGKCGGTGKIASEQVLSHTVPSLFWTGPLRSPSRLQNTFAHECFMDEVSSSQSRSRGISPKHLRDERLMDVVRGAAKAANWSARPSPRPGIARTGVASGREFHACCMRRRQRLCGDGC